MRGKKLNSEDLKQLIEGDLIFVESAVDLDEYKALCVIGEVEGTPWIDHFKLQPEYSNLQEFGGFGALEDLIKEAEDESGLYDIYEWRPQS